MSLSDNLQGTRAPFRIEMAAYRIAQEAVSNIVRQARATSVEVELVQAKGYLHMHIVDDAVGADPALARLPNDRSTGVMLMEQRATVLGGKLEVAPAAGGGTSLGASFPLYAEAAV